MNSLLFVLGLITYYFYKDNVMFTGDFLFKGTIGRTDLESGNMDEMINSLNLDFDKITTQAISLFQNSASSILNISVSIISSTISGSFSCTIAFIFSIYILM